MLERKAGGKQAFYLSIFGIHLPIKEMKKLLSTSVLVLMLASSLFAEPTWYQPPGWKLGTTIPAQPEDVSENKIPVPQGEIVESRMGVRQGDDIFIIDRVHFPSPIPPGNLDAAYQGGIESMQRGKPQDILNEEKISIGGHEGRRWTLRSKEGLRETELHAVIIGDEAYEFIYERPAKQTSSAAADAFFSKIAPEKS